MLVDTHCHLDVSRFAADRAEVLARAVDAGVGVMIIPAIGPHAWDGLLEWAAKEPRVRVALGIHPQFLPELNAADDDRHLARLESLMRTGPACAIGECGLDGGTAEVVGWERQRAIFDAHLEIARRCARPVLAHALHAQERMLEALSDQPPLPRPVVLHSYSGSGEMVPRFAALGCYFSFAGAVTRPRARKPLEAARAVPPDRLLLETDSPDQTPFARAGARNEPAFLPFIRDAIAEARGLTAERLTQTTTANAEHFFQERFSR